MYDMIVSLLKFLNFRFVYSLHTHVISVNARVTVRSGAEIKKLLLFKKKERGSVTKIANRLGSPGIGPHEWLILTPKDKLPKPDVVSFPKPPKASDGSLLYDRVPNKIIELEKDLTIIPSTAPSSLRKRVHEEAQLNGTEGICHKILMYIFE